MKTKLLLLLVVFTLAFLHRSYLFLHGDVLILQDQGRDLLLVREIVERGDLILIGGHTGFGGLFHGPLWIYLLVPTFALSGGHPFWTLVPLYLLVSLGIVATVVYFGWRYYGWIAGIMMGLGIAVSHTFAQTINYTSNAQMMPLFFVIYLIGMVEYLRGGSQRWLLLSAAAVGLGVHVEVAFAVMLLPMTVLAWWLWKRWPSWQMFMACCAVLFLCVSNYLLFDVRNNFLMTRSAMRLVSEGTPVSERTEAYKDLGYRVIDRVGWMYETFRAPLPDFRHGYLHIITLILTAVLVVFCLFTYYHYREMTVRNKEMLFFLLMYLLIFGLYIWYPSELHAHYVQSLALVPIIVLGYILSRVVRQTGVKWAGMVIAGLFVISSGVVLWRMYSTPYVLNDNGSLLTNLMMIDRIFEHADGNEFGYFVYDPPIVTYGPDYLIQWRGRSQWGYVPVNEKRDPTYLFLYAANIGDDRAHEFFKQNVVRTEAEVLWREQFAGNTTVEQLNLAADEQVVDPNYFIGLTFR